MSPPVRVHTKKILVIKNRALGDTVLLTAPLLELVRYPHQVEVDLLVPKQFLTLFEHFPGLTHKYGFPTTLLEKIKLAKKIRDEKYDICIAFHASTSAAAWARWTGAKQRVVHFHGHRDPNRFSTVEIPGKGELKSIIERDLDCLRSIGMSVENAKTSLFFGEAELNEQVSQYPEPCLAIAPGASRPTKQWPIERFFLVAQQWCERSGGTALWILGPQEVEIRDWLMQKTVALNQQSQHILISSRPLRELALILKRSRVFLGCDSGPKHLAIAVGTPTLTVFGPEDPFEWHPYDCTEHPLLFVPDLKCRNSGLPGYPPWCGLTQCTVEKHRCMEQITSSQVFDQLISLAKL